MSSMSRVIHLDNFHSLVDLQDERYDGRPHPVRPPINRIVRLIGMSIG